MAHTTLDAFFSDSWPTLGDAGPSYLVKHTWSRLTILIETEYEIFTIHLHY